MRKSTLQGTLIVAFAILAFGRVAVAASASSTAMEKLFLSNGQTVNIFTVNNQRPGNVIGTLQTSEAEGLAVNGRRLFVARGRMADVLVYNTMTLRQIDRLRDPGQQPDSIAFGMMDTVYVGNTATSNGGPGSVSVYEHGSKTPSKTLTCAHINTVNGIAVNGRGDVFVNQNRAGSGTAEVDVFPATSSTCRALPISEYSAGGLALDPATQDLLIADAGYEQVLVVAPPYNAVSETISLPRCIGERVWDMALDSASSFLYISDPENGADTLTFPGGGRVATYQMSSAVGIAVAH